MRPKHPYKRRQYLVDPAYQLRFVTRVFMAVMGVVVVSSILSSALLAVNMYRVELGLHAMLIGCLIAVAVTLLIELLLAIPIVYIFGVRSSHRIVGPMKRIKQTLEAIGKGDFSQRITLRQGDALEDLAKSINQMAINLQQRSARSSGS
ncbi:MAG: HAMP domain-containing protein [Candidatus Omnitrophica bacterium]|nr:HAMP domain-containing protein [Candidatus Omnitrophota bacterium]MBI3083643.1 HAMP domain-containing protein [Candidatus Omnitrophota bacterium]